MIVVLALIVACQKSELVGDVFTGSELITHLSDLDESINPGDLVGFRCTIRKSLLG